jgi:M6 family metalloprotease-like protein
MKSNLLWALPAVALGLCTAAWATTLTEFGHGSIKVDGRLPLGTRPLLVIVANYAGTPALADRDWEQLIFGSTGRSLVNYYREVSNGRFTWSRAGLLRANFSQAERMTVVNRTQRVAATLAQNPGFNALTFDADNDGTVRGSELSILIIHNLVDAGGKSGEVRTGNLALQASDVAHRDSLMTMCHEICHTLGATDLYGANEGLHNSISLMGPTIATDSNQRTYHLDPWHKMVLGWCEPRIVSLRGNGRAVLPAAQLRRPDGPVLLFDPVRGTGEFYLLEYRTRTSFSAGEGFDANVADGGLLVWHVWQNPDHTPVQAAPHTTGRSPAQPGWTICKKCQGNFYRPNQGASRCPAGGAHEPFDEHDFDMVWNTPDDPGQQGWRWCRKCQGMFFGGNALPTRCPADNGAHDGSASAQYVIRFQTNSPGAQRGWAWCRKCQGLFYAGLNSGRLNAGAGVCPASGQHDATASGEYTMHYQINCVFSEAPPNNALGQSSAWRIGQTTPFSRWFADRTEVPVRYQPRAILKNGDELLVEWTSELLPPPFTGETWADYRNLGIFRFGTFDFPYASLSEAVANAPFYRRILFKPGSGRETLTIRQSVRIEAPLGPVTIGR